MKKESGALVMGFVLMIASCTDQNVNPDQDKNRTQQEIHVEGENKPTVDIKVNRVYDDDGNLVAFDSTYTSYYSSVAADTITMDSLYLTFQDLYKEQFPALFERHFYDLFMNDTLYYDDFFHDDFFNKRVTLNTDFFKSMAGEMDSIKNEFYRKHSELNKAD